MTSRFLVRKDDPFLDKVLKYIPPEVVAAFVAIEGALLSTFDPSNPDELKTLSSWMWITFIVLLIITPLYRWRVTKVTNIIQLLVTTLSFAVWVFALGGPFTYEPWYQPVLAAVVLPIYTLIIPIIIPGE